MAEKAITVTMHAALKRAAEESTGRISGVDNGVMTALLKRGLGRDDGPIVVITDAGRWAVEHAPINPRSKPETWGESEFQEYLLRHRGSLKE